MLRHTITTYAEVAIRKTADTCRIHTHWNNFILFSWYQLSFVMPGLAFAHIMVYLQDNVDPGEGKDGHFPLPLLLYH